jgi:hypothetical protein
VTYQPVGGSIGYQGAFAAKCSPEAIYLGELSLTRETVTPGGQICGTADFTQASGTIYRYLGGRTSSGDTFRYWGTTVLSSLGTTRSATAARCD